MTSKSDPVQLLSGAEVERLREQCAQARVECEGYRALKPWNMIAPVEHVEAAALAAELLPVAIGLLERAIGGGEGWHSIRDGEAAEAMLSRYREAIGEGAPT